MNGTANVTEIVVDRQGRKVFVIDGALAPDAAELVHDRLCTLPVSLTDTDRPDTNDFRHFKHDFFRKGDEPCAEPFVAAIAELAREFFRARGIEVGDIYRIYLNVNLFGDFQFAHTDGNGWTVLLFANKRWDEDWGGEIVFYPEDQDAFCYSIYPRPGRLLVFDSTLYHRGGVPSKFFHGPRMSVAIKFSAP